MAQTIIVDHEGKFLAWVTKVVRKYRLEMFKTLAVSIDTIRKRAANKYILPDRYPEIKTIRKKYLKQPTHPTMLTSRTGLLKAMLKENATPEGSKWNYQTDGTGSKFKRTSISSAKIKTSAFDGIVKVTGGLNTPYETYEGKLVINVNKVYGLAGIENISKWYRVRFERTTPQQAAIRFRWETGIKGKARPFFGPAVNDETVESKKVFMRKLAEIGLL